MCMICAAIPVTAAVGAKWNADQLSKPVTDRKPVARLTGLAIAFLITCSIAYHTFLWRV
jgi:hypothetical protein